MWIMRAYSLEGDAHQEFDLGARNEWVVGRSTAADICIDWDPYLSRRHLQLKCTGDHVLVEKLSESKNQLLYQGAAVETCQLGHGDEVLAGSSLFRFLDDAAGDSQAPCREEISFSSLELRQSTSQTPKEKAEQHLQLLASLPMLLEQSSDEEALLRILLSLLSQGISEADGILLLKEARPQSTAEDQLERGFFLTDRSEQSTAVIEHAICKVAAPTPCISQRLWRRALKQKHGALLHLWDSEEESACGEQRVGEFTADGRYDWAFCIPLELPRRVPTGLYVYGHLRPVDKQQRERIDADVRFTNLLVEIASAMVRSRQMDQQQRLLERFFPHDVARMMILDPGSNRLDPRECALTVIYCDVQGFTARSEQATENLMEFLEQISTELECATQAILKHQGVIGDFHGDAVMGFWGWPLADDQAALRACLTALEIQRNLKVFQQQQKHQTKETDEVPPGRMRIGIASGYGLAGTIGTADQMKVTAFGTVVNRAQRLQELCKQLHSQITIDEETASQVEAHQIGPRAVLRKHPEILVPGISVPLLTFDLQELDNDQELSAKKIDRA